jgi:glucosamine--fructose-6-phosphate aminotransferase (isomerizing)
VTTPGAHTLQEIRTQADAWAAVLGAARTQAAAWRRFFAQREDDVTLFFGCGSTYYLSLAAASVFQTLAGRAARGVPAAELFLFPETWLPVDSSICGIALSRSGTTTETIRAADHLARNYQARLAVVTCYADTPLEARASVKLISPEGHEESIAQTRSFSSMLVGCIALAGLAGGQANYLDTLAALPSLGERLMQRHQSLAESLGGDLSLAQVFFLGSGSRYGLACEAMLKLKEMSLTHSEAYHFLEFRHGPKSMVDAGTLVVGLLSDAAREAEVAVLREMKELGATLLILTDAGDNLSWADHVVSFDSNLPELARLPLYLPVLQMFAFYRSLGKGLNPDAPRYLDAVVRLSDDL